MTQNVKRYEEEAFALFSFFVVPHVLGMATYYTHKSTIWSHFTSFFLWFAVAYDLFARYVSFLS